MKKLLYFTLFCTTLLFAACENNEPNQPPVDSPSTPETPVNPDEPANPDTPNEPSDEEKPSVDVTFSKEFSVGIGKTVLFSPGNLQYNPASKEWRFAPNQTDMVGNGNLYAATGNGWIDLFGWGTGDNPTKTSMTYEDYTNFVDWGVNKIGNDEPNTWRSLSYNEWSYILDERENAKNLISVGRVKGNNGVILLPDNWVCPEGVDFKIGFGGNEDAYATFQIIDEHVWDKLEESGAIFLPACGYRQGTTVKELQESCRYWIGYWHTTTSASLFYSTAMRATLGFTFPYDGMSVRLVSSQTF
jgi:hypothetical protein